MVKKLLAFLILCMALALVRTLLMVLAVVLLLALVHAFVARPRETMVFLGTLILSSLAVAQPFAFIAAFTVIGVAIILAKQRRKAQPLHIFCKPARK
ncbi:hypothetical protein [Brevundimonas vancanneytii]|uniref:Uncharacterized protein n=1 Tax=Brevundimonas vancanneytii TaxID=1325724 RepID=A0A4P1KK00_9CAUL|nr:hypothetical protein [Brevundimonas vancanneytii]VTO19736.1 Uncharacterised protein [Brevundimonas vancanneytii]